MRPDDPLKGPMHGDVWDCFYGGRFSVMHVCSRCGPPHVTGYWHDDDGVDPHRHGSVPLVDFLVSFRLFSREEARDA